MLTGRAEPFQTEADIDETSRTGLPSVGQYIRKILLVSDNDAFNRLYEFIGQRPLNEAMAPGWHEFTRCIVRVLTREESLEREEVRIQQRDGLQIPVGMTATAPPPTSAATIR